MIKSIEMGSCGIVYIQGFITIGAGILLGSLKSCRVGITEGKFAIDLYLEIEQFITPHYIGQFADKLRTLLLISSCS